MPRPKKVVLPPKAVETKSPDTSEENTKPEPLTVEEEVYSMYVHGDNVAAIAAHLKLDPQEVFTIVTKKG